MKEIRITKMVEQTTVTFEANDGKQFTGANAERECKNYEMQLNKELCEKEFKKLKPIFLNEGVLGWFSHGEISQFIIVNLKDSNDFDCLRNYCESGNQYAEFDIDEPREYPKQIVVSIEECWICEYTKGLDVLMQQFESVIEKCHKAQGGDKTFKEFIQSMKEESAYTWFKANGDKLSKEDLMLIVKEFIYVIGDMSQTNIGSQAYLSYVSESIENEMEEN